MKIDQKTKELMESIMDVNVGLFTACDGGDMWCSIRSTMPNAKEKVKRLENALSALDKDWKNKLKRY